MMDGINGQARQSATNEIDTAGTMNPNMRAMRGERGTQTCLVGTMFDGTASVADPVSVTTRG